jgi:adenylate kinase family enzyme
MEDNIATIKNWLGTGSINIFGLPYSGKDTIGIRLAESLGGKFVSSGLILRSARAADRVLAAELDRGALAPTDTFRTLVLPYFSRPDLAAYPLVLGMLGRWSGEEQDVMASAQMAGHTIKAVLLLNISESDIYGRWEAAHVLQDRGDRADDRSRKIIDTRVKEFQAKVMPVIQVYRSLGLLVPINADQTKDAVFTEVIQKLTSFALAQDP